MGSKVGFFKPLLQRNSKFQKALFHLTIHLIVFVHVHVCVCVGLHMCVYKIDTNPLRPTMSYIN